MQPDVVDPTDRRVLERNYDYAQKNLWILSMWYEYDVERMVELLAVNEIPLSANDERRFGEYYNAIRTSVRNPSPGTRGEESLDQRQR